jgi:hypothetical protein
MKKYIFGILVAVSLTACGNSTETETTCKEDSTCVKAVDSVKVVKDTIK